MIKERLKCISGILALVEDEAIAAVEEMKDNCLCPDTQFRQLCVNLGRIVSLREQVEILRGYASHHNI